MQLELFERVIDSNFFGLSANDDNKNYLCNTKTAVSYEQWKQLIWANKTISEIVLLNYFFFE